MFRKFYMLYDALCEEIDQWRLAIRHHREMLEAKESPSPPEAPAETNGVHKRTTKAGAR